MAELYILTYQFSVTNELVTHRHLTLDIALSQMRSIASMYQGHLLWIMLTPV